MTATRAMRGVNEMADPGPLGRSSSRFGKPPSAGTEIPVRSVKSAAWRSVPFTVHR
jgi:hypothetical protein